MVLANVQELGAHEVTNRNNPPKNKINSEDKSWKDNPLGMFDKIGNWFAWPKLKFLKHQLSVHMAHLLQSKI